MNEERLREHLKQILQTEIRKENIPLKEWNSWEKGLAALEWQTIRTAGDLLYIPIGLDDSSVTALVISSDSMTGRERQLINLIVNNRYSGDKKPGIRTDNERFITEVRDWIEDRVVSGELDDRDPPEHLTRHSSLFATKVPFLVYGEYANSKSNDYADMKKLLETFFDGDIQLVPLMDKEWLVLGNESLLIDSDDESTSESIEEQLASLCSGLHAVISTEGAGDCHVAAYYPIVPVQSLPTTVIKMREAISIGRLQRVGQYIHLPWELYLDQLLSPLTHTDRLKFIEQVFKRKDPQLDREMIQTLETFFELNCNVSETAKHLYIHRNTLLYRLDKFKNESGLDVRTFNQAVHVKIALQLYKVTKRL
jgi:sugar diacid utilization regulator